MAGKRKKKLAPTIAAVAEHFERDQRTIKTWLEKGCPGRGSGGYDLVAIAEWRDANIRSGDERPAGERGEWEIRHSAAQAQLAELRLAKLRGELVEVAAVADHYGRHIAEAKTLLEQLPDRLLAGLPKANAKQRRAFLDRTQAAVRDVLTALQRALETEADTLADGGEDEE